MFSNELQSIPPTFANWLTMNAYYINGKHGFRLQTAMGKMF